MPAGGDRVEFLLGAFDVSADKQVSIAGSVPGRTAATELTLLAIPNADTHFAFVSYLGDPVGKGEFRRFTAADASFAATCVAGRVTIDIVGRPADRWTGRFGAPRGAGLQPGVYENAGSPSPNPLSPNSNGPEMGISGNGVACTSSGLFVVHDMDLSLTGVVRGFSANFEQRCQGRADVLKGWVRVTNPTSQPSASCIIHGVR